MAEARARRGGAAGHSVMLPISATLWCKVDIFSPHFENRPPKSPLASKTLTVRAHGFPTTSPMRPSGWYGSLAHVVGVPEGSMELVMSREAPPLAITRQCCGTSFRSRRTVSSQERLLGSSAVLAAAAAARTPVTTAAASTPAVILPPPSPAPTDSADTPSLN